jgi:hypothetical protein
MYRRHPSGYGDPPLVTERMIEATAETAEALESRGLEL